MRTLSTALMTIQSAIFYSIPDARPADFPVQIQVTLLGQLYFVSAESTQIKRDNLRSENTDLRGRLVAAMVWIKSRRSPQRKVRSNCQSGQQHGCTSEQARPKCISCTVLAYGIKNGSARAA